MHGKLEKLRGESLPKRVPHRGRTVKTVLANGMGGDITVRLNGTGGYALKSNLRDGMNHPFGRFQKWPICSAGSDSRPSLACS